MYRFVIRGSTHKRRRPNNARFGGGSIIATLVKRKATDVGIAEYNWLGFKWMETFNGWDGKRTKWGHALNYEPHLPSLNQVSFGLIAEAMVQLKQAMGNIKDQKAALEAEANIKKTWVDLLDHPKI